MGAKTCKCNVGEDEEDQLKLSRDPEAQGKYDFPTSTQDLGVSALVRSSGSNHVPPLVPGEGDHADVAAGMHPSRPSLTQGKLPAVAEETGEDLESLSRQPAESETGNSRPALVEQLSELKEALQQCADSNGQLVPIPGEERLSRTGADVAAGLQQPSASLHDYQEKKTSTRRSSECPSIPGEERKSSRKEDSRNSRSQQATSLVYCGAATDAYLATEEQRKECRRSANLDNGNGQIIDMTLPVATHLALDSSDDPKSDKKDSQHEKADAVSNCSDNQEPESGKYTCWQMADKSGSCLCPPGSGSIELSRDGRSPSEHYDVHGATGPVVAEHVSALVVPPVQDQGELTENRFSQPDSISDAPPPPPENGIRSPVPDLQDASRDATLGNGFTSLLVGDLRTAGKESGDPAAKETMESVAPTKSEKEGSKQQDTKTRAESNVPKEDGLDAEWINEGQVNKLQGSSITFASGETCAVEPTSKTTCHMVLEGTVYYGRLSPDRKKLLWSDGDVWTRKEAPKPNAEPPGSEQGENPDRLSRLQAETVTFEPGPIGFKHNNGLVTSITAGGQAERAGVKAGWRLTAVGGEMCNTFSDKRFENARLGSTPYQATFIEDATFAHQQSGMSRTDTTPGGETPAEKKPSNASKQSAKDKDKKETEAAVKDDGEEKPAKACCTIS